MPPDDNQLKLNPNPSADDELKQTFSNPDDKRLGLQQDHEHKMLKAEQGWLGGLIGCSDSSITIAFAVIFLSVLGVIGCVIGIAVGITALNDPLKTLVTVIFTFGGYVFGVHKGKKP